MRTIQHIENQEKGVNFKRNYGNLRPLAERLGMHEIRTELDDLSFKVLEPDIRESIINRLKLLRQQDEDLFEKIQIKIEEHLKKIK